MYYCKACDNRIMSKICGMCGELAEREGTIPEPVFEKEGKKNGAPTLVDAVEELFQNKTSEEIKAELNESGSTVYAACRCSCITNPCKCPEHDVEPRQEETLFAVYFWACRKKRDELEDIWKCLQPPPDFSSEVQEYGLQAVVEDIELKAQKYREELAQWRKTSRKLYEALKQIAENAPLIQPDSDYSCMDNSGDIADLASNSTHFHLAQIARESIAYYESSHPDANP